MCRPNLIQKTNEGMANPVRFGQYWVERLHTKGDAYEVKLEKSSPWTPADIRLVGGYRCSDGGEWICDVIGFRCNCYS